MSLRIIFAAALLLCGLSVMSSAQAGTEPLTIVTASGPHAFNVEVMHSQAELERGLMFRKSMAADHGMLFDFKTVGPVSMWMKNTLIPLDMLFIGADGRVVNTAENAVPMSERVISSHGPVLGVLELNAGTVATIGVKPGDRVDNAMFPR